MPKCLDCGNTREFITAFIEFQIETFQDNKLVDQLAGDRERLDETYPPECRECNSTNIEGDI